MPVTLRFRRDDVRALDRDKSGNITAKDLPRRGGLGALDVDLGGGVTQRVVLGRSPADLGLAARLLDLTKHSKGAIVEAPAALLRESPTQRALLAAHSYGSTFRTMDVPQVLDAIVANPDPKLGVFSGGLRDADGTFRTYAVVGKDGALVDRTATYDGTKAYLYVPADQPEPLAALQAAVARDPKYANVEIRAISKAQMGDHEERMQLKYDRPGVFWVSSRSPATPHLDDKGYIVPGGRFGIELYYHDTRINLPSARATVVDKTLRGDGAGARDVLSAMRGTVNALANSALHYGKIFNATLTPNAGRSQAPCLTNGILETYRAWKALAPNEVDAQKAWLTWAADAAKHEYQEVWTSAPRFDPETGLSRYTDESASIAPEEDPHFYAGIEWSADDIVSDASIREHGWDSMPQALMSAGEAVGKPRVQHLLPVCLNSLLFRYEKDLAFIARELHGARAPEAAMWEAKAQQRSQTMNELLWDKDKGLFVDVVKKPGEPAATAWKNGHEDLRSFAPLWAGIVAPGSKQAKAMHARIGDFLRPGGIATATAESWDKLHALNPAYTDRCQWGHKDIGWPITTYETVKGLADAGFAGTANEIAYRWLFMVQSTMEERGGLHASPRGGFDAPIFEKMDVTYSSPEGAAAIGYGNQGGGDEGVGSGFRWGLDAYKLLYQGLPLPLQQKLRAGASPDALFGEVEVPHATKHAAAAR